MSSVKSTSCNIHFVWRIFLNQFIFLWKLVGSLGFWPNQSECFFYWIISDFWGLLEVFHRQRSIFSDLNRLKNSICDFKCITVKNHKFDNISTFLCKKFENGECQFNCFLMLGVISELQFCVTAKKNSDCQNLQFVSASFPISSQGRNQFISNLIILRLRAGVTKSLKLRNFGVLGGVMVIVGPRCLFGMWRVQIWNLAQTLNGHLCLERKYYPKILLKIWLFC